MGEPPAKKREKANIEKEEIAMMTKFRKSCSLCLRPIACDAYTVGRYRVRCTLYEIHRAVKGDHRFHLGFALELGGTAGHSLHMLGHEEKRARNVYEMMVRHAVTPCTAEDILQDLTYGYRETTV